MRWRDMSSENLQRKFWGEMKMNKRKINSSFCLILRKAGEIADLCTILWWATDTFNVVVLTVLSSFIVFLDVSFNADKLYWTLWVKQSKQNIHAILWISSAHMVFYPCFSCAISVCREEKLWASISYCSRARLFTLDTIFLIIDILHHSC